MTYAIAIINKNLVNRTVSFDNELVPLNGRITKDRNNIHTESSFAQMIKMNIITFHWLTSSSQV